MSLSVAVGQEVDCRYLRRQSRHLKRTSACSTDLPLPTHSSYSYQAKRIHHSYWPSYPTYPPSSSSISSEHSICAYASIPTLHSPYVCACNHGRTSLLRALVRTTNTPYAHIRSRNRRRLTWPPLLPSFFATCKHSICLQTPRCPSQ